MHHKIGDLVYHPTICEDGCLGEIVEIRYSKNTAEARWFGEELNFFVSWHDRLYWKDGDSLPVYSEEEITIMKRWLNEKVRKDAA